MFNIGQAALIVPCSEAGARLWAAGEIRDAELILNFQSPVEAFYFASLPSLSGWREAVRRMFQLFNQGARVAILRTNNRVVRNHAVKLGARETFYEGSGFDCKVRYLLEAEHVEARAVKIASVLRVKLEEKTVGNLVPSGVH